MINNNILLHINTAADLCDYKFFCFGGRMEYFKIDFNRQTNHGANYYDRQGHLQEWGETAYPLDLTKNLRLPSRLEDMIALAEKLSFGIPFLRVDFYETAGAVYFGELTFYPGSGMGTFTDPNADLILGELIDLQ